MPEFRSSNTILLITRVITPEHLRTLAIYCHINTRQCCHVTQVLERIIINDIDEYRHH